MSTSRNGPRKSAGLTPQDHVVLNLIKSKGDQATWDNSIPRETELSPPIVKKCTKTLLDLKLIKKVKHFQYSKRIYYIGAEFTPADDFTGGSWFVEGKLDTEFIDQLKKICHKILSKQLRVATSAGLYDYIKRSGVLNDCTSGQISEILRCMVLENRIIEVKSTGLNEYYSIPIGDVCYKAVDDQVLKIGAMASIPCGMCPNISKCTPDGLISPRTCEYYTKWLAF